MQWAYRQKASLNNEGITFPALVVFQPSVNSLHVARVRKHVAGRNRPRFAISFCKFYRSRLVFLPMNETTSSALGRVASLHLHPREAGEPFQNVTTIEVETQKGIVGNPRYFARMNREGQPSKRQVSLIEREQISEHATTLGLEKISPGTIRANIETAGADLVSLVGQHVRIGGAILFFYEARTGCAKMDAICSGLRKLSGGSRLGVLAQVVQSGRIQIGDEICLVKELASC